MTDSNLALMAHLLRRAGFGASRQDVEEYAALGYEATVEELLHPENAPPPLKMKTSFGATISTRTASSTSRVARHTGSTG